MNKEEIKDYLKRVDDLEVRLTGEDKETFAWLIYGYNQCAKLLNETQKENKKLKAEYGTKAQVERDLLKEENEKYKEVIDDAIQFIKDTCIEQVPDMPKGCYREIASIGDLLDLLDILKEVK